MTLPSTPTLCAPPEFARCARVEALLREAIGVVTIEHHIEALAHAAVIAARAVCVRCELSSPAASDAIDTAPISVELRDVESAVRVEALSSTAITILRVAEVDVTQLAAELQRLEVEDAEGVLAALLAGRNWRAVRCD